jgi:hypothetical protein
MKTDDHMAISVTGDWNDWQSAHARIEDLGDVHWHQPQGAPHPLLYAYVSCTDLVGGTLAHRCGNLPAPHRVRVCILKSRNMPAAYTALARKADEGQPSACPLSSAPARSSCPRVDAPA